MARNLRGMWPVSLEAILETLGLKILVIEDEVAAARTLARREPVQQHQQRFGNASRLATKQLSAPPPALSIVRTGTRRGSKYG